MEVWWNRWVRLQSWNHCAKAVTHTKAECYFYATVEAGSRWGNLYPETNMTDCLCSQAWWQNEHCSLRHPRRRLCVVQPNDRAQQSTRRIAPFSLSHIASEKAFFLQRNLSFLLLRWISLSRNRYLLPASLFLICNQSAVCRFWKKNALIFFFFLKLMRRLLWNQKESKCSSSPATLSALSGLDCVRRNKQHGIWRNVFFPDSSSLRRRKSDLGHT